MRFYRDACGQWFVLGENGSTPARVFDYKMLPIVIAVWMWGIVAWRRK